MSARALATWVAALGVVAGAASCTAAGGGAGRAARPDTAAVLTTGEAARLDSAAVLALLGGLTNAACPLPGVGTGGQPDSAGLAALGRAGFRAVLDLRMPDEPRGHDEPAIARAAGLSYRSLPVSPATLTDETFDRFRSLMRDSLATPVLVHCASGNRVGALMVPWLVLDRGWPVERAMASAEAGGLRTPLLKERALDYVRRRSGE